MNIIIYDKQGCIEDVFLNATVRARPAYDRVFHININDGERTLYVDTSLGLKMDGDKWILHSSETIAVDGSYVFIPEDK